MKMEITFLQPEGNAGSISLNLDDDLVEIGPIGQEVIRIAFKDNMLPFLHFDKFERA